MGIIKLSREEKARARDIKITFVISPEKITNRKKAYLKSEGTNIDNFVKSANTALVYVLTPEIQKEICSKIEDHCQKFYVKCKAEFIMGGKNSANKLVITCKLAKFDVPVDSVKNLNDKHYGKIIMKIASLASGDFEYTTSHKTSMKDAFLEDTPEVSLL